MEIILNGDSVEVDRKQLTSILVTLGYECKKIVVAVNESFVAKDDWDDCRIEAGDRLDVLSAIEGG